MGTKAKTKTKAKTTKKEEEEDYKKQKAAAAPCDQLTGMLCALGALRRRVGPQVWWRSQEQQHA